MDARHSQRFSTYLPITLKGDCAARGSLISISAGGCAIRTATHLRVGMRCEVTISSGFKAPALVIWGVDDYRIDTFYRFGLRFIEALSDDQLKVVLREEELYARLMTHKDVA